MPAATIEFKKKSDGSAALTIVRADGSRTSSTIGSADGFGPVHDLSHYAVESILGVARGFFGLCAEGWSISDFEKDASKTIPPEALVSESLSGETSRMEITSQWNSLEDFNWTIAASGFTLSAVQYEKIRRALTRLRAEWNALAPGATMSLRFDPGRTANVNEDGVIS